MKEQLRAYQISLGLHGVFALAVLVLSSGLAMRARPPALDLSLLGGAPAAAPDRPLHPRARPGARPAAAPSKAAEPAQPQVQRVNPTADMAPVAAPPAPAPAEPAEAAPISRDAVRENYIKEKFTYIRDRIHRNLVYPRIARKMGWSGRVMLSFVVGTDGLVKELKVVTSCGFGVLDRSAADTVKMCEPYPPPPVETEFLMPVTYKLE